MITFLGGKRTGGGGGGSSGSGSRHGSSANCVTFTELFILSVIPSDNLHNIMYITFTDHGFQEKRKDDSAFMMLSKGKYFVEEKLCFHLKPDEWPP